MLRSQTLSLRHGPEKRIFEGGRKKKKEWNLSDPSGRRTYLYIWISSQEGSVWNLIHKHYPPPTRQFFPLPEEKTGSSSEPLWGNFFTTRSSFRRFNTRADWDLAPVMFHQRRCLQPSQVCLSVKRLLINRPSTFLRFSSLLSSEMWISRLKRMNPRELETTGEKV